MQQQNSGYRSRYTYRHFKRSMQFYKIEGLQHCVRRVAAAGRFFDHRHVELKIQNVVWAIQKRTDELFLRTHTFEIGIEYVICVGREAENPVFTLLISHECAD